MIQSVHIGDDADLVQQIIALHSRELMPTILDATYGHGGFWRGIDLAGQREGGKRIIGLDRRMASGELDISGSRESIYLVAGDYTETPFADRTFDVILFDPPFLTRGGDNSVMKTRYTAFATYEDLLISLQRASEEFARLLKPKGIVVAKSMDFTEGRRRKWMHMDLTDSWSTRFRLDDLIVKIGVTNMRNAKITRQERSKSAHCYFMVFRPIRASRAPDRDFAFSVRRDDHAS